MPGQSEVTQVSRPRAGWALSGWLALCFAIAAISFAFAERNASAGYMSLAKAALSPIYISVWIVLYVLMGFAAWLVWKTRPSTCRRSGLRLFLVQLWFNALWSWIFFSQHQIGTAFVDLVVLWAAILLTARSFRKVSTAAAWLMAPYLGWVTYLGYLNLALWLK